MPIEQPPAITWLIRNWRELQEYNFQWIAATSDGLVAYSPHLEDVISAVVRLKLTRQVAYALVELEETSR